jgi:hypothetical protein
MKRSAPPKIGSWLIRLGLIGLLASVIWWRIFYSQLIGSTPVECLYELKGSCQLASNVARLFGTAAYDARLLWASGILTIVGVLLRR